MEIIKEDSDRKTPLLPDNKAYEKFIQNWRQSEFYSWVMEIINNELSIDYLKDAMYKAYSEGSSLEDRELSKTAFGQFISEERIKKIKDTLS